MNRLVFSIQSPFARLVRLSNLKRQLFNDAQLILVLALLCIHDWIMRQTVHGHVLVHATCAQFMHSFGIEIGSTIGGMVLKSIDALGGSTGF